MSTMPENRVKSSETDSTRADAIYRSQIRQRIAAKPIRPEQLQEREQRRQEIERKKAEAIANTERDAPIRARFHAWMKLSGFQPMPIPEPGRSYPGSHIETLWEAYLDATLKERESQ